LHVSQTKESLRPDTAVNYRIYSREGGCLARRTFPNGASEVTRTASFTSGGGFATRTRFVPSPATAMATFDNSPFWCSYLAKPPVSLSIDHKHSILINMINTCLRMPSICIMLTVFSGNLRVSWIHSWISYAGVFGLAGSNVHTIVLHRSTMMNQEFTSS